MASKRKRYNSGKFRKKNPNLVPGTVYYTGKKHKSTTGIEIIDFSKEYFQRFKTSEIEQVFKYEDPSHITWINVDGLNNSEPIIALGNHFNLHPLIQEDIVNIHQRPRIEEYDDFLFMVFKMLHYNEEGVLTIEHMSLVMGKDYILTFQEADFDVFDDVKDRLEQSRGRIRSSGSDYLMFSLMDAVIDNYFSVVEFLSNKMELLEDKLFDNIDTQHIAGEIQELKKDLLRIRRAVLPLREVISKLEKIESSLIEERTNKYIRNLYDHIIQVQENVEIYREMIWGLMDMHLTNINNKMNEVMKVLTIMASIFIPLTFLAGIYGMNFEYMPELSLKYGYFYLLGIMFLISLWMIWYFKRKKWF